MNDFVIFISLVSFIAFVGFTVEYYRQIVKVKNEYEKVKATFYDIILSFSRELKRTAESLETVAYKAEASAAKSAEALSRTEEIEGKIKALETKIKETLDAWNRAVVQISDFEKQYRDIVTTHQEMVSRISALEEKIQRSTPLVDTGVEIVIPIKREKALAHLTGTELAILEMLALEGPKTAPEIKDRIKLSREHTARLMKKLYEEGYVERDASKIPFRYSVKKELEKLLKKTEPEAV